MSRYEISVFIEADEDEAEEYARWLMDESADYGVHTVAIRQVPDETDE